MKVTFDTNVWTRMFSDEPTLDREHGGQERAFGIVRAALASGQVAGFISEAVFRIEAIQRKDRRAYFAEPHTTTCWPATREDNPDLALLFSFGPDNAKHPGLPDQQIRRLKKAAKHGIKVIRTINWMGLPVPTQLSEIVGYAQESQEQRHERELRQMAAFDEIRKRGVGKAAFDESGGWIEPPNDPKGINEFIAACAEWADGELVAGHIGYLNDILCTNDRAVHAGVSVFNAESRSWLTETYGARIVTVEELAMEVVQ